jgi:predicted restriction endonuclease
MDTYPPMRLTTMTSLNQYNGLLLLANLDKAFDRGYISFLDTGKIVISEKLAEPEVLGINSKMRVSLQRYHQEYLAFHREQVFRYSA